MDFYRGGKVDEDGKRDLRDDFLKAVNDIFSELENTIKSVFMFKEENTFTVTQRIYDVNKLTRRLIRLRTELERTPMEQARIEANRKPEFRKVNCD